MFTDVAAINNSIDNAGAITGFCVDANGASIGYLRKTDSTV